MRIDSVELYWFRGAAAKVALDAGGQSGVVYGVNGAGKSSFVDAVEYVLHDGKIEHLTHEYSGKRQEKAVLNTQRPPGAHAKVRLELSDKSEVLVDIAPTGIHATAGSGTEEVHGWEYRRTILRQDEVAAFIRETKGGKYSALLPLLGLHDLELAAENVRQLARSVGVHSKLASNRSALQNASALRVLHFPSQSDAQVIAKVEELYGRYCDGGLQTEPTLRCKEIESSIDKLIASSSADQRRYIGLHAAGSLKVKPQVAAVRMANTKLIDIAEPLLAERLSVLESTTIFAGKLGAEPNVTCPSCGTAVPTVDFKQHVETERRRLAQVIGDYANRRLAISGLCDLVKALSVEVAKPNLQSWREPLKNGTMIEQFQYLESLVPEDLRSTCTEEDLKSIEAKVVPIVEAAASASAKAPAEAVDLSMDKQKAQAAAIIVASMDVAAHVDKADSLVTFLESLEVGVREEIKTRSKAVIDEISADVRTMWSVLHPTDRAVADVHLYVPEAADKSIDIGLKFHGSEQDSPRLTLSEGYRNALGLCIFLAMAKRERDKDRPVLLDDVVVSLDRHHRGMILELLEKEFKDQQVLIFTHDREWYTELRLLLDGRRWKFRTLLPYETPTLGIRWSHKTTTFDDARGQLADRPDGAGNDARKIMDVELALMCERIKLRMPYLRADKNDRRMAHDFLERILADGRKAFQRKEGDTYIANQTAISALEEADRLILAWANRASHSFELIRPEAVKLIDTCEAALDAFKCSICGRGVWFADAEGSEWMQCQCGVLRWRYGKT